MWIFDSVFGKYKPTKINWVDITNISQIDEISNSDDAVLIFKHSTICRKSRRVLRKFQKRFDSYDIDLKMYCLDLREYRDVSCELGVRFNVIHESPQVIIIKDGRAVIHDSQEKINKINIKQYI